MTPRLRLVVAVGVLSLLLAYMVAGRQFTLATGAEVVLAPVPVDPRSLFRGDFVRLEFGISDLDSGALLGDDAFEEGDPVYVHLRKTEPSWEAISMHHEKPGPAPEAVVIKGWVISEDTEDPMPPGHYPVRYGIESFFIPQGEGGALEDLGPEDKISMVIAVDRFGTAAIKTVLVNGEPLYSETLF